MSLLENLKTHQVRLAELADSNDLSGAWPVESLQTLASADVFRAAIPKTFGGLELSIVERAKIYQQIARSDLSLALIVSQRDRAVELFAETELNALKQEWLPRFAASEAFTTVGFSHLTTSKSSQGIAAKESGDALRLNGTAPWVTGAKHADSFVTGATLEDGKQVLVHVPLDTAGINIHPPMQTTGVTASHTSRVSLKDVVAEKAWILYGPCDDVLHKPAVPRWVPTAVIVGFCQSFIDALAPLEGAASDAARQVSSTLLDETESLRKRFEAVIHQAGDGESYSFDELRAEGNFILLRLMATLTVLRKGSGYVQGPDRLAREAMFFYVWSLPERTLDKTIKHLM